MRALFALAGLIAGFLLAPALGDLLEAALPAGLAGALGWLAARALVPSPHKLQNKERPGAT